MYFIIYERSVIFMSRKIIFFDADGTIINKTFISSQTVASVNQLKMNGHIPVLATGRARKSIQQIVDILDLKYLICSSGNHIIINDQVIFQNYLSYNELQEIVCYFDLFGLRYTLECADFNYIQKGTEDLHLKRMMFLNRGEIDIENLKESFQQNYRFIKDLKSLKVQKIHWYEDPIMYYENPSPLDYQNIFDYFHNKYLVVPIMGNPLSIHGEISKKGVSKKSGMEKVLEYFHADIIDTYAIGDDYNDLEMLQYAKHTIAMGQAPREIKEVCEFITDDIYHEGFTKAMNHYQLINGD